MRQRTATFTPRCLIILLSLLRPVLANRGRNSQEWPSLRLVFSLQSSSLIAISQNSLIPLTTCVFSIGLEHLFAKPRFFYLKILKSTNCSLFTKFAWLLLRIFKVRKNRRISWAQHTCGVCCWQTTALDKGSRYFDRGHPQHLQCLPDAGEVF